MAIIKGEALLIGVHPDLVRVIKRAAMSIDFVVTEGLRTLTRQKQLVAEGKSRTLNSRHIKAKNGLGHAVDICPYVNGKVVINWTGGTPAQDRAANGAFTKLSAAVKAAAKVERVPVEWGGDWKSFKDGPHWQLPWANYNGAGAAVEVAAMPRMVAGELEGVNPKPLMKSTTIWSQAAAMLTTVGTAVAQAFGAIDWKVAAVITVGAVLAFGVYTISERMKRA